jgi:hypothetical protein
LINLMPPRVVVGKTSKSTPITGNNWKKIKEARVQLRQTNEARDNDKFLKGVPDDYLLVMNPNSKASKYQEKLKITGLSLLHSNLNIIYENFAKLLKSVDTNTNPNDRFLDCMKWFFANYGSMLESYMESCHLDESASSAIEPDATQVEIDQIQFSPSNFKLESIKISLTQWTSQLYKLMVSCTCKLEKLIQIISS